MDVEFNFSHEKTNWWDEDELKFDFLFHNDDFKYSLSYISLRYLVYFMPIYEIIAHKQKKILNCKDILVMDYGEENEFKFNFRIDGNTQKGFIKIEDSFCVKIHLSLNNRKTRNNLCEAFFKFVDKFNNYSKKPKILKEISLLKESNIPVRKIMGGMYNYERNKLFRLTQEFYKSINNFVKNEYTKSLSYLIVFKIRKDKLFDINIFKHILTKYLF